MWTNPRTHFYARQGVWRQPREPLSGRRAHLWPVLAGPPRLGRLLGCAFKACLALLLSCWTLMRPCQCSSRTCPCTATPRVTRLGEPGLGKTPPLWPPVPGPAGALGPPDWAWVLLGEIRHNQTRQGGQEAFSRHQETRETSLTSCSDSPEAWAGSKGADPAAPKGLFPRAGRAAQLRGGPRDLIDFWGEQVFPVYGSLSPDSEPPTPRVHLCPGSAAGPQVR